MIRLFTGCLDSQNLETRVTYISSPLYIDFFWIVSLISNLLEDGATDEVGQQSCYSIMATKDSSFNEQRSWDARSEHSGNA